MEIGHQIVLFQFTILFIASTEAGISSSRESSYDYNNYGHDINEENGSVGNWPFGEGEQHSSAQPSYGHLNRGGMHPQMPYGMNGGMPPQYGMQGGMRPLNPYNMQGGMRPPNPSSMESLAEIAQPGTVINGIDQFGISRQATVVAANLQGANPTLTVVNQTGTQTLKVLGYEPSTQKLTVINRAGRTLSGTITGHRRA
ncbi:hypothetical protein niasHT_002799 [Heterodera trifolii]|uniref:Uncharacterized protein n=1 Tax=Heterodera trifolii TaxID=157864 RepID=A0ABD2M9I6_9BILA